MDEHTARCPACAERLTAARELDGELRRLMSGERGRAARFAERLEQRFLMHAGGGGAITDAATSETGALTAQAVAASPAPPSAAPSSKAWLLLPTWLVAMAAGFLLAVLIFEPWKAPTVATPTPHNPPTVTPASPSIAQLVVATGEVSIRPAAAGGWSAVEATDSAAGIFTCPAGSTVKTQPGVRCELRTTDGCVFRLNADSQVTLRSARSIDLERGQVWCSAPDDVPMVVSTPQQPRTPPKALQPQPCWTVQCMPNGSLVSAVDAEGCVRLTAARGAVDVRTGDVSRRVPAGETVTLIDGQLTPLDHREDALLAAAWIDQLLVKKGPADPELLARVDTLLAAIGRAKSSYLYEQELRALGEHCVLPLLRFVQSPVSREDLAQRQMAMRIVADLAPSWAVGDLIPLLSDSDREVRVQAATALLRLTGQNHGREPAGWRNAWDDCTPTYTAWQSWWQTRQGRYPSPDFSKDIPLPAPKGMKKA